MMRNCLSPATALSQPALWPVLCSSLVANGLLCISLNIIKFVLILWCCATDNNFADSFFWIARQSSFILGIRSKKREKKKRLVWQLMFCPFYPLRYGSVSESRWYHNGRWHAYRWRQIVRAWRQGDNIAEGVFRLGLSLIFMESYDDGVFAISSVFEINSVFMGHWWMHVIGGYDQMAY